MKNTLVCAVVVMALASFGGCKLAGKLLKGKGGGGEGAASAVVSDEAREAMGLYATGYNALLDDPKGLVKEYYDAAPLVAPEGSKGGDVDVYSLPIDEKAVAAGKMRLFPRQGFARTKITEARTSFDGAKKAAPSALAGLAPLADAALAGIEKVLAVYEEAQKYCDAQDYKDDKGAKARDLHARMGAAAKAFNGALDALDAELSRVEDQQALSELAQYEAEKGYGYWFRFYNIRAKALLDAEKRASAGGGAAVYEAAFTACGEAYNGLTAFANGKGSGVNTVFKSYADMATAFDSSGKKLLRQFKEDASPEKIDPLADDLVSRYNNLVGMTNSLFKMEDAGLLK